MAELLAQPELYFMQRLASVRRAQSLTASMQFDLARSPLPDDQLEQVVDGFGGKASSSGFGFSEVMRDLVSREPRRLPINDLRKLQENLKTQGYAPPAAMADGVWDPSWYAYFRRWDRDNYEKVVSGHHWGAAPIEAGFRAITNTLPSRVWQGLLGSAKGLVQQAPETAERVGLVGGAVGGAAIGGAIGSAIIPGAGTVIGAGLGAIAGGVGGFLADFFGSDEGEVDQSTAAKLIDALSPFEEYRDQGWSAFWEDLGFVGTAASLAAGVGMAARGVATVATGIRAAAPTIEAAAAGPGRLFVAGRTGTAVEQVSAGVNPALRAALMRPPTAELGPVGQVIRAATQKFTPGTAGWIDQQMMRFGPLANFQRPAIQIVTKGFSGLSAGQMGARLSAGFDLGTGAAGETTIEKAIAETEPLRTGIELPLLGDLVDWAAFVMVPERFLPFRARELGAGAVRMLGDTALRPFAHAIQKSTTFGLRQAANYAKELVTPELNTYMRLDYGIHTEALRLVNESGIRGGYNTARAQVVRDLHAEMDAIGTPLRFEEETLRKLARGEQVEGMSKTADLVTRSLREPAKFEGWLYDLPGTGIEKITNYKAAAELARRDEEAVRAGRYLVTEAPEAFVAGPSGLEVGGFRGQGFETLRLKREAETLEQTIKTRERAARRAADPQAVTRLTADVTAMKERLSAVKAQLEQVSPKQVGQLRVLPATKEFLTRRDLFALRDQYLRMAEDVRTTFAGELDNAQIIARENLRDLVQRLAADGYIPDSLARKVIESGADPGRQVADHLEDAARTAARDVELPTERMAAYDALGYKPVVTGEDVVSLHDIPTISEAFGVGDYTRRAAFFETLGMSPRWQRDQDLFALRVASERSELNNVFAEHDIPLAGGQAITRLRTRLTEMNHEGVVIGPVVKPIRGRARPYLVDVRELSPDVIKQVFDDIPEFSDDVALDVYAALKRGAAYGGEAKFLHPVVAARDVGRALRINGLPGFADFIRTARLPVTPKAMAALGGAAVGAGAGALVGDEPGDILRGAILGAGVGAGYRAAAGKYGYLPDRLARLNTALRYTFSATFDAGRYSEQNLMGATMYNLPPVLAPKKYAMRKVWRKTPYGNGPVTGEEAWSHVSKFFDDVNGTAFFQNIDDTDRRLFQAGLLGFSPWNHEAVQAFMLYQRGWSNEKIREAVSHLGRYGLGRTAAEKSANFVFFPFSFSKKLLTSLGDFMLQAPGRNLVLTEGIRRYHESALDERFHSLIEDHLPLLEQLWTINNLAFGLSPGRFFLEGIDDHRTAVGAVMQVLSSVFVPSGAAGTLAAGFGQAGDLAMNVFTPVVVTGESVDRAGGVDGLDDIIRRYVPLVREIDQYFVQGEGKVVGGAVGAQIAAATEGRAPFGQLVGYLDGVRNFKTDLEPLALAMGYSSVEGFLASDLGAPMQTRYDQLKEDLREQYPTGWKMVSEIDNTALIDEAALNDLAQKADPSKQEEAILAIAAEATALRTLNADLGVSGDIGGALVGARVRELASRYAGDRRFGELYDRFFAREYGPIRQIA